MSEREAIQKVLDGFNFLCFLIGMAIVWSASHNWLAIVGVVIAAVHFRAGKPSPQKEGK